MSLTLHRAARTDTLAEQLGEVLAQPLADPFAKELVLVPAKGIERWLSQRLSHRLGAERLGAEGGGVCAGVEFRSPQSLMAELIGTRDQDPWAPEALVWPLLEVIDRSLSQTWARTLALHLGEFDTGDEAELKRGRRYSVARRLAGLFASYAAQRPELLTDWVGLPPDLAWQRPLWEALVADLGSVPTPLQRHEATLERLRGAPSPELPPRLSLFGHTRLPVTEIALLQALSTHHDLHLWLPHPSPALWAALRDRGGVIARSADDSHRLAAHPLLATLGRDLRELQRGLHGALAADSASDVLHEAEPPADTLLGWLQADVHSNSVNPSGRVLDPDDRSISVHACHGPARQIAVLREVLLGLLDDDPSLEPRDILVMCPDIESYAPLINAAFGLGEVGSRGHPAHRLRVQLADRALTQTNELLAVADILLNLAGSRATASQVLDLAEHPAVRRRFGLSDDDLDTLAQWVREAGIRWGFDQHHREPFGLGTIVHNTWRFGLDRVLTGVAMSDDSRAWLGSALPLDDVDSNQVELAGRFAEFIDRLAALAQQLTGAHPLAHWLTALAEGIASLTAVDRDGGWQVGQLHREFAAIGASAGARAELELRLPDVRSMLRTQLAGRPTRANFRSGTLTVCTMVPMRSVPHRVVALVGLDDDSFPRTGLADGDDVLARDPLTGERDVRAEDRQLLLDAITAARDKLVITYTGTNVHSGQERPPSVPLGELFDALDVTTLAPVRDQILIRQPLQYFDPRNVIPGDLGAAPGKAFSFDPTALDSAHMTVLDRPAPPPLLSGPLPVPPPDNVELAELEAFLKDPAKGFFRALDFALPGEVDGIDDAISVELDGLQSWGVGDRMLSDVLNGVPAEVARGFEWRRGALPPGRLGWAKSGAIQREVVELAEVARAQRGASSRSYDVDVDLGGGRRLTGTVGPVFGGRLVSVAYSKSLEKPLLSAWVRTLALASHDPDHNWSGLVIARHNSGPRQRLVGPVGDAPLDLLKDLVALFDAGRCEPLPLPLKTSYAYAEARRRGGDPEEPAKGRWDSGRFPGESEDPVQVLVHGPYAPLSALLTPAQEVDRTPLAFDESTRLGALAVRLWGPLFEHERALH